MQFVADLHLHSKYSRAVSQNMVLPIMAEWGRKKGIDVLSTGDWTHPLWLREIGSQLEEKGEGLYGLKRSVIPNSKDVILNSSFDRLRMVSLPNPFQDLSRTEIPKSIRQAQDPEFTEGRVRNDNERVQHDNKREPLFLLSTEIASIYKQGNKLRRIHNLVFAPDFETAEKVNKELVRRGCNLHSDGRPIIGLTAKDLLETILSIDDRAMLIPCHVWTPHFGIYGSASGFDSLEEAFGDLAQYVYGIETGLSSDPEMNWQMLELKNRSILSFSDAHSPAKMGREATVFELEESSYENIRRAIVRTIEGRKSKVVVEDRGLRVEKDIYPQASTIKNPSSTFYHLPSNRIIYTIEFYPEEGKYHFSGHRNCGIVRGPEEIKKDGNICTVCKRELTEGVLYRVSQLGDKSLAENHDNKMNSNNIKWYIDKTKKHPPYVKLVPLMEIVAEGLESTVSSQKVKTMFDSLCEEFGSEINILLKTPIDLIRKSVGTKIGEGIEKVRKGTIVIDPGFDGEYGRVKIWNHDEAKIDSKNDNVKMQMGLGF